MDYNANINHLRYFQTVCKCNNVTQAAVFLNISQPSVTMAIKELEEQLSVSLFYRHKNRLHLTDEGKVILEKTNALLGTIEDFFTEVTDLKALTNVRVKLGIPPIIGTRLIPKIYSSISDELPGITLEMYECVSEEAEQFLNERIVEVAIALSKDISEKFNHKTIYETELMFCINKNHPLAKKKSVSCKDIDELPIAVLSTGSFHYNTISSMFKKEGVDPNIVLHSQELNTISQLLRQFDIGTFTYRDIFESDDDIALIPYADTLSVSVSALWKKNDYIPKGVEKVIKFLTNRSWL